MSEKLNQSAVNTEAQVQATSPAPQETPDTPVNGETTKKTTKKAAKEQQEHQLAELATKIRKSHGQVIGLLKKTSVIAHEIGLNLIQAKKIIQARKDYWGAWLKANCGLTARQAQKYMRLARHWKELEGKGYDPANASIEQNLALLASVDATMFPNGRPSTKAPPAAAAALPLQVSSDEVLEYKRELAQELVQDNRLDFSDDSAAGKLVRGIVAYAVQQVRKQVPHLKKNDESLDPVVVAIAVFNQIRTALHPKALVKVASDEATPEPQEPASEPAASAPIHNGKLVNEAA